VDPNANAAGDSWGAGNRADASPADGVPADAIRAACPGPVRGRQSVDAPPVDALQEAWRPAGAHQAAGCLADAHPEDVLQVDGWTVADFQPPAAMDVLTGAPVVLPAFPDVSPVGLVALQVGLDVPPVCWDAQQAASTDAMDGPVARSAAKSTDACAIPRVVPLADG